MLNRKAMIFAAGLGTRMKPLTDKLPKALVPVRNKPLLQIVIEKLIAAGFEHQVINVHHFPEEIRDFLQRHQNFNIRIDISDESDKLLDTGGGLKKAASLLRGADLILLHNVDVVSDINLEALTSQHVRSGSMATLAVRKRETSRYLLFDERMRLRGWENTKTGQTIPGTLPEGQLSRFGFSGVHVIQPNLLDFFHKTGPYPLIPEYVRLAQSYPLSGYDHTHDLWIDAGKAGEMEKVERVYKKISTRI